MDARSVAFQQGAGETPVQARQYECKDCGYSSTERRHFKTVGEDHAVKTCATGHYQRDGELHRARNPYAR